MAEPLQIHTIVSMPFQENTYVVWRTGSSDVLVVDPGLEPDLILAVLDVPGHSPGHVAYLYRNTPCVVFGGDVLFRGGIGRYDLPNSSGPLLFQGIRDKLFTLPPDTVVYPGHGPATTVGNERQSNPF